MSAQEKERGRPAGFDPRTGAVHGSGSGAGGAGSSNEDYDADQMGGGGADPVTAPPDEQHPDESDAVRDAGQ